MTEVQNAFLQGFMYGVGFLCLLSIISNVVTRITTKIRGSRIVKLKVPAEWSPALPSMLLAAFRASKHELEEVITYLKDDTADDIFE
ncbi:MAG: hypothetical protein LBN05_02875 [Oscillospiraceae bacterium]|jgi:hypothetical protein|nr:hypothetical protein [Oscillospiraceae bacterium]